MLLISRYRFAYNQSVELRTTSMHGGPMRIDLAISGFTLCQMKISHVLIRYVESAVNLVSGAKHCVQAFAHSRTSSAPTCRVLPPVVCMHGLCTLLGAWLDTLLVGVLLRGLNRWALWLDTLLAMSLVPIVLLGWCFAFRGTRRLCECLRSPTLCSAWSPACPNKGVFHPVRSAARFCLCVCCRTFCLELSWIERRLVSSAGVHRNECGTVWLWATGSADPHPLSDSCGCCQCQSY
jgi:hypothetical protein